MRVYREFYEKCFAIQKSKGAGYKRHPMMSHLYGCFESECLGNLAESKAFKELKANATRPEANPEELNVVDLLVQVIMDTDTWKSRHAVNKNKLIIGVGKLQKCLAPYLDENGKLDPRHLNDFLKDCQKDMKHRTSDIATFFTGKRRSPEAKTLYDIVLNSHNLDELNTQLDKLLGLAINPLVAGEDVSDLGF